MRIAVLRERQAGEARVGLVPDAVKKLVALKASVAVESGAGLGAGASDEDYSGAGAEVSADHAALLASADVLVSVNRPSDEDLRALKSGAVLIGFLRPLDEPSALEPLIEQK